MSQITGDEIVSLLGVSESDDRMLDLFEKLGVNKDEFERDEDDGAFWVELEDEIGLDLSFSDAIPEEFRNPQYIGGQYLIGITFYYNFKPLPYGLEDTDSLNIIEKKLSKKANYIDVDDADNLYWMYKDLGWLTITFEDDSYEEIHSITLSHYTESIINKIELIKPFER